MAAPHFADFSAAAGWEAALAYVFVRVLPIWAFGALVGMLMPRPRWAKGARAATLLVWSPTGAWLRSAMVAMHAAFVLREVWKVSFHRGTFRGVVRATVQWLAGRGWSFQWPALPAAYHAAITANALPWRRAAALKAAAAAAAAAEAATNNGADDWYVGEKDLAFFKYHAVEGGALPGASAWEVMLDKDIPGYVRYTAWRRTLPGGKTEYKSVTVAPRATAHECMDMHLDDAFRPHWDGMVVHHEVLEHGDFSSRQQVVRWIRRFPFSFLSDREYTIARRVYKEVDPDAAAVFASGDGSATSSSTATPPLMLYGLTRALAGHPREARDSRVVKMDVFWSMWRSRTVRDPWGGAEPACETVLLHHEQFKIPENLARFAVRHGMWGFVRKMASTVPQFSEARRARAARDADDAAAYGAGCAPNPPLRRAATSSTSLCSASSLSSSAASDSASDDGAGGGGGADGFNARAGRRMRGVAAVLLAGGLALALGAAGGSGDGSGAAASAAAAAAGRSASSVARAERRLARRRARRADSMRVASCMSIAEEC